MADIHPRRTQVILGCAMAALVVATSFAGCSRTGGKADDKPAAEVKVEVTKPLWKSVPRIVEQPGTILAYEETKLLARVAGYVSLPHDAEGRIFFDIGQTIRGPKVDPKTGKEVQPGDVLAAVVVPELAEDVKQKKARTRQAQAEVEQSKKALAAAEANIAMMEANVDEAKALNKFQESESKRITKLAEKGGIDPQARDESLRQLAASAARVVSTNATVLKAKADRDKAIADVTAIEAKVDVMKAEAGRAETMHSYASIRAPYDGKVVARKVNTGDLVQPMGAKGEWLFTVARLDPVRIVITIPEADAGLIQLDKSDVSLNVPAAAVPALKGPLRITRTSWALEPSSRTLRAEIDFPNKEEKLRPGMYVYAKISTPNPETWTLPASAVVKQGEVMVCFQIDEQNKAIRQVVQVGKSDGHRIEVFKRQKPGAPGQWEDFTGTGDYAVRASGLTDGQTVQR